MTAPVVEIELLVDSTAVALDVIASIEVQQTSGPSVVLESGDIFNLLVDSSAVDVQPAGPVEVDLSPPTTILAGIPGAQGSPGPPGTGGQVVGQVPTGSINGSNTVFTTAVPFLGNTTAVYLNGLREYDYTETGPNEITFSDPPLTGDSIRIDYVVA